MADSAVELFQQMPSEYVFEETYVCVLNACSHAGLVNTARSIFATISNKTEKIYSTMVDCLGRRFQFEEAEQLIAEFESHHAPSPTMLSKFG